MDWKHIEEIITLNHKISSTMGSSRAKEKRETKEHISPGIGGRYEKNEQYLGRNGKEILRQSRLKNAGRRSTLHVG